jgi:hypothetical protein
VPLCLYTEDAEVAVLVVEGDPLDDAGYFLGRGSVLWDCSVHLLWGLIFPWTALACATHQEADFEGFGSRDGVWVGSGVSEAREAFVTTLAGGLGNLSRLSWGGTEG